jgi:hypothetical protein
MFDPSSPPFNLTTRLGDGLYVFGSIYLPLQK